MQTSQSTFETNRDRGHGQTALVELEMLRTEKSQRLGSALAQLARELIKTRRELVLAKREIAELKKSTTSERSAEMFQGSSERVFKARSETVRKQVEPTQTQPLQPV